MNDSNHRLKNHRHPSSFVKTEIIDSLNFSVKDAVTVLGITRQALSLFLNQQSDLSPDIAIRIDKAFGVSMEPLMRMQNAFDIAKAIAGEIDVETYQPNLEQSDQPGLFERKKTTR
jgi:addiction module HigA family antidote